MLIVLFLQVACASSRSGPILLFDISYMSSDYLEVSLIIPCSSYGGIEFDTYIYNFHVALSAHK